MNASQTAQPSGLGRVPDVARYLSLCRMSVYRMIERGDLPSVKIHGARRIPWAAVLRYVEEHTARVED